MNILLVEDDPGIGRFVSRGLAAEGFTVQWLRTGREARETLAGAGYAAAILDLGLPDIDGLELCSALRREGVRTPILMLTARGGLEDKLEGFRSGADDYLSKPFAFQELLARLHVLARRGGPRGEMLSVGALTLDLDMRAVRIRTTVVPTPSREFDVLACLARAAPRPATRPAILDQAWGPGAEIADNTLDVYIGYLRRRLAGVSGAPRIETVRGVGFRLVG